MHTCIYIYIFPRNDDDLSGWLWMAGPLDNWGTETVQVQAGGHVFEHDWNSPVQWGWHSPKLHILFWPNCGLRVCQFACWEMMRNSAGFQPDSSHWWIHLFFPSFPPGVGEFILGLFLLSSTRRNPYLGQNLRQWGWLNTYRVPRKNWAFLKWGYPNRQGVPAMTWGTIYGRLPRFIVLYEKGGHNSLLNSPKQIDS